MDAVSILLVGIIAAALVFAFLMELEVEDEEI